MGKYPIHWCVCWDHSTANRTWVLCGVPLEATWSNCLTWNKLMSHWFCLFAERIWHLEEIASLLETSFLFRTVWLSVVIDILADCVLCGWSDERWLLSSNLITLPKDATWMADAQSRLKIRLCTVKKREGSRATKHVYRETFDLCRGDDAIDIYLVPRQLT
jgi:hypothetical protein